MAGSVFVMAGSKPKFMLTTLQNVETNTKQRDKCIKRFAISRCLSDLFRLIVDRTTDKQAADTWQTKEYRVIWRETDKWMCEWHKKSKNNYKPYELQ